MHDLREHYNRLSRVDKILYKDEVMKKLGIDYGTFYNWLTRNAIPKRYQEQYANEILDEPVEKVFPEFQTA